MQRRDFLKMASAAGVGIPSWALLPAAHAQSGPYTGRILINVHASGGIDQSSWADPRETDPTMNNYAGVTPAGVAGNIRFAPMGNNAAFFGRYFRQMLVVNGVHSETNSHEDGTQVHATGSLAMGYPNIAELFASTYGKGMPMAWLNAGGFRNTVGLVPPTPVPDVNAWRALTQPNAQSATTDYMKQADLTRAQMARTERMRAMQARGDLLPRSQRAVEQFVGSADSRALLQRVADYTPANFDAFTQAHVGLIAAQAGITSTIQLASGGFDGHNQLTNSYNTALPRLTDMVDYIWQKSADLGLSNRIFLRIYSEFGRTPLNNGNGKDHWAIGTQVLMEANPAWGNRVFGASGPRHQQLMINTGTGAVDPAAGKLIKPRHIHAALRKYLGVDTTDPRFNLKVPADEAFDFFNPSANTGYPNL